MLIYCPVITPRVIYIMNIIVGRLWQTEFRLTDNIQEYENHDGIKFAYGNDAVEGIYFNAVNLLFEENIRPQLLSPVSWHGLRLFFPVDQSAIPFDPFALAFYLITRYEEYLPDIETDVHNRFKVTGSAAFLNGFHRKPVINIIANILAEMIRKQYPDFPVKKNPFRILTTYDVDIAYQYKVKNTLRFTGSLLKSILKSDFNKAGKLLRALGGKPVEDEYDTFDEHRRYAMEKGSRPVHFTLTAPFGKYDRNISPESKAFRNLVRKLSEFSDIGIHPSYYSSEKEILIGKEKKKLEKICGFPVMQSRQHFLRFSFPDTFRALMKYNITDDYSLGWPDEVGFRASIANPFPWYDLSAETETSLILHPLTVMDGALAHITKNNQEQEEIIRAIIDEVQNTGGEVVTLSHNSYSVSSLLGS